MWGLGFLIVKFKQPPELSKTCVNALTPPAPPNPPSTQRKEDRYAVGSRHGDPAELHGHGRVATWRFKFHTKYRTKKTTMWRRLKAKIPAEDPQAVVA